MATKKATRRPPKNLDGTLKTRKQLEQEARRATGTALRFADRAKTAKTEREARIAGRTALRAAKNASTRRSASRTAPTKRGK